MIADDYEIDQSMSNRPRPAWAYVWHLWTIIIPRRSITGRLVRGTVWRRCDGRYWIYKECIEFANIGDRR
jgi:hypothetical protein